jgi:4-amino-4-deoxy-L-arabinose transferase-like glycosyltransferase
VPRRWSPIVLLCLAGLALYAAGLETHPPGLTFDESAIALNAHEIAASGRDEHGAAWPLYFRSLGDFKGAPFIYLLAGAFELFGPGSTTARLVGAVLGVAAAGVLMVLATRVSGHRGAGVAIGACALLTPWLFETSRFVFEVAAYPLLVAALLLVVHVLSARERWSPAAVAGLVALLALVTYTYAPGRVLGPLLALGLALLWTERRRPALLATWGLYAAALVPLAAFALRHRETFLDYPRRISYLSDDASLPLQAGRFAYRYAAAFSPHHLLVDGAPNEAQHAPFLGVMLAGVLALTAAGVVATARAARTERWPRYLLFALVATPVPAALTTPVAPTHRLIALAVVLVVLAAAGAGALLRTSRGRVLVAVAVAAAVIQGVAFQVVYRGEESAARLALFDAGFPALFAEARRAGGGTVHLPDAAYTHARWRSVLDGRSAPALVTAQGRPLPRGGVGIVYFTPCRGCRPLRRSGYLVLVRCERRSCPLG